MVYAISSRTPFLYGSAAEVAQVKAVLINGPSYLSDERKISILDGGQKIFISPHKHIKKDVFENNRESKPYGLLDLVGKFTANEFFETLTGVGRFSDFVTGMHCGIGHIIGYNDDGVCTFCYIGFGKFDSGKRQTGWYDIELERKLSNIYEKYIVSLQDADRTVALRQAMNYYRGSNVTRSEFWK